MKTSGQEVSPNSSAPMLAIAQLSSATAALRSVLYGSATASRAAVDTSLPIRLSALTLAFDQVAKTRKVLKPGNTARPELAPALAEYQHLLREFKSNLPRFQGWLLAERARLGNRSSHSAAVDSWMETNRQTRKTNCPGHAKH